MQNILTARCAYRFINIKPTTSQTRRKNRNKLRRTRFTVGSGVARRAGAVVGFRVAGQWRAYRAVHARLGCANVYARPVHRRLWQQAETRIIINSNVRMHQLSLPQP